MKIKNIYLKKNYICKNFKKVKLMNFWIYLNLKQKFLLAKKIFL
jgi:hypothetical protein